MEQQLPLGPEISEPIVNSNQVNPENNLNEDKIGFNQNQVENLSIKLPINYMFLCYIPVITLLYLGFSFACGIPAFIIGIFYVLLFLFLILYNFIFKFEINKSNSTINVNIKNIFGKIKNTLNGNIHFYQRNVEGEDSFVSLLFIINDSDIDLDTENIKIHPTTLFYYFQDAINEEEYFKLRKKIETGNFENPFFFDISKYIGKNLDSGPSRSLPIANTFMKFGEHLFTVYLIPPNKEQTINYATFFLYIYILNIPFYGVGFASVFFNFKYEFLGFISLLPIILFPIIAWLLCLGFKKCCSHDTRIDIIFSKNYDKIFIGKVNYKQDGYSQTFEYQMSDIDRIFFQQPEVINGNSTFKVVLKNKQIDEIQLFKGLDRNEQEGLEYFLNGKLNN